MPSTSRPLPRPALFLLLAGVLFPDTAPAQIALASEPVQEYVAAAGESYRGTILVRNPTDRPQVVQVYQSDYQFFADGRSLYEAQGSHLRSNAGWLNLSTTRVTIPPFGSTPIGYEVQVPAAPAERGTYWSMVMVEGMPPATRERASRGGPTIGIQPVLRYGVQVVSHLQGGGERRLALRDARVARLDTGDRELEFAVFNTGEQAYRPAIRVEVYSLTGELRASFEDRRGLLYPGSSLRAAFRLPRLPDEPHKAIVIVDAGEDQVFGAQYDIS